ncbi:hypothetical protein QE390_001453 [Siphonobacter sp. SORGH_AS 1065]|nr:hypothetical protein [Siphonobacter sp. SORGH_AS_1065]
MAGEDTSQGSETRFITSSWEIEDKLNPRVVTRGYPY